MNTPIHVKLEYKEALNSKRNLLSSQRDLLKSLKLMNQYYILRLDELKIKAKLHRAMKETLTDINKIEKILPKANVPKILRKEEEEGYQFTKKQQKRKEEYSKNIEEQLAEIQNKLRMLQ